MVHPKEEIDRQNKNSPALTMGYTIMASIIFFSFIGYKLDEKFHTQYWFLVGVFSGFAFSGYEIWKLIKSEKEIEKQNNDVKIQESGKTKYNKYDDSTEDD